MATQQKNKNRPYFSSSLSELLAAFEKNKENQQELTVLLEEISHRSTPRAKALGKKIAAILEGEEAPPQLLLSMPPQTGKPLQASLPLQPQENTPPTPTPEPTAKTQKSAKPTSAPQAKAEENAARAEREATIEKMSEEIERLKEDLSVEEKKLGHDKVSLFFSIAGFIFIVCIFNVYDDVASGKVDGITQLFFSVGLAGIPMLIYGLYRERRQQHRIGYLKLQITQKRRELHIFTTGKFPNHYDNY